MTLDPKAPAFTPAFKTVNLDPAAANGPSSSTHSKYLVGHIYEIFETTSSFAERLFRKSPNYDLTFPIALEGARILDEISKEGSEMGKIRPCIVLSTKWEQEFDEEPRNWGAEHWGPKIALGATFGREAFEDLSQVVKGFVVGISPNPAGSSIGRQLETSPPWLHSCQWFIAYGFHSKRRVGRLWRGRNADPNIGYCLPPGELKRFRQLAMDLASTWYEACEKDASLAENCAVSFRNHRDGSVYARSTQNWKWRDRAVYVPGSRLPAPEANRLYPRCRRKKVKRALATGHRALGCVL